MMIRIVLLLSFCLLLLPAVHIYGSATNSGGLESEGEYSKLLPVIVAAVAFAISVVCVSWFWVARLKKEVEKREKIQAALVQAKEEAEVANAVKSTFLARMSHEIRTPLNAITGMTYLMKKTEVSVTQKLYIDKISHASRNMLGIINDILDFSKIEADKLEIDRISFNLDEVLQHVINIVSFKIDEQGIDFFIDKEPQLPSWFFGDPKRMEQILINLVNNAVKFTAAGQVSVTIRAVAIHGDMYHIEFSVKDTGIGMSEEQVKELFEPYIQGDVSINRRYGGSGLGLSIVKSLIDKMNGEIKVYSALDEGSTFNVQLALETDRDMEFEEKQKRRFPFFIQKIRVLVLEKNHTNANLLRQYLHSFQMVPEFTLSEKRVLELLRRKPDHDGAPYDLIIVDYDTPMFKGIEFIERIQQDKAIEVKPKFILMFSLAREDLFDKVQEMSIDLGITKPIIPSVLYNGIVDIFKNHVMDEQERTLIQEKEQAVQADMDYHVLIVEDNKTNQFIAKSVLEQGGFRVYLADDGKEGYDFYTSHADKLDLILMDLYMPVLDGYEATELIRRKNAEIPIVAMTADAITGVDEKCRKAGITDYVSKPFEPDQLLAKLIQLLKDKPKKAAEESEPLRSITQPVLDTSFGMLLLGNKPEMYKHILRIYHEENEGVPAELQRCLEEKNVKLAVEIVHKIKGSSGNIGAKKMYEAAGELQLALTNNMESEILVLCSKFSAALTELYSEIEAYLHASDSNQAAKLS